MGGLPTIDWNEETILDELMQPAMKPHRYLPSMPALFNCDERRTARTLERQWARRYRSVKCGSSWELIPVKPKNRKASDA